MNNKGFTLIELIITIALLSIISVISFVSILSVVDKSKINDCNNLVSNIKSASKEYVSDNRYNFNNNDSFSMTVEDLITKKYLTSTVVDPFTNEELEPADISVLIELNEDYSAKKVTVKNKDGIEVDCDNEKW